MTPTNAQQAIDDQCYWTWKGRQVQVLVKRERRRLLRKVGTPVEDALWRFIEDPDMEICIMGRINV